MQACQPGASPIAYLQLTNYPPLSAASPTMANPATTIADSDYARKRREIFTLVKDLRAMGAESDIDIPKIAVIGGQSAGKSSLVEAVTGINVPRDSGTCTRCPMECTILTTQAEWSCQISLKTNIYKKGTEIPRTSKKMTFSPCLTANDKDKVEIWLRRAQAAILSPHSSYEMFKSMDYEQLKALTKSDTEMLKFSRDAVVVDIEDPDGTDLSFIDLPGLIQNEKPEIIAIVKSLVEQYVQDESTVVLVTIPANDDLENQQAALLAREADPKGKRTIGVVTKTDTLGEGSIGLRQKWLEVFQGKTHQLALGYYAVRLSDDTERGTKTRQEMNAIASQFFASNAPWKELLDSGHLGIPNLIHDISSVLMGIIHDAIPKLREQIQAKLQECIHDIEQLPEEVTVDATTVVLNRVSSFCTDLQGDVYGRNESKDFVHKSRAIYKKFKLTIRQTAPDFRPFIDHSQYVDPGEPVSESERYDKDIQSDKLRSSNPPMDLTGVRHVIEDTTGWELPHNVPYESKTRLIKTFIEQWPAPAHSCFDDISSVLYEFVDEKIALHFGRFKALEQHIAALIRTEAAERVKLALKAVRDVLEREKFPYMTQNGHYLESSRENWLAHYRTFRNRVYHVNYSSHGEAAESRCESPISIAISSTPGDNYEDEIIVMADVRAYFQVAYKRITDNIPMTIQRDLNQELVDGLYNRIVSKLGLSNADAAQRLSELLDEDPAVIALRVQLVTTRKRLEDIQAKLNDFVL
ncbi:uncharacterized protein LAESUDRAFT_705284 [Laetiporus sulphureus 93-53]|uniref:P-loop containing nucleoside triphosphate hydrolase protein n=1 Tax=Laetiporus sulphureus 93-53 TaxID=1314785 RepID=A0A165CN03_9APHY|nr:uncharacterized protein LAESUDRAFT_705284 [Laetiporus sulphureus 93-53]KZT03107.1 hypothetical protein LAESUDRAFT_705284 [Laetiporus sulphureus 93-53]